MHRHWLKMANLGGCSLIVDNRGSLVRYYREKQRPVCIRFLRDDTRGCVLLQASGVAKAMSYRDPYVEVTNAIRRIPADLCFGEHVMKRPIGRKKKARFLDPDGLRIFVGYCYRSHCEPAKNFWQALTRSACHLGLVLPPDLPIVPTKETEFADHVLAAVRGAGLDGERQRWLPRSRRSLDVYFSGQNVVAECDERETHVHRIEDDRLREQTVTAELRDIWTKSGSIAGLADCAILRFVPETDDVFCFVGKLLRELFDRESRKGKPRIERKAEE